jgi:hypothetical protein
MNAANKIYFNRKLYSLKSVETAAEIYREFAQFKIIKNRKYIAVEVDITDNAAGNGQIINEFENYALLLNIKHVGN